MADRPIMEQPPARAMRVALFSGNYNCVADGANQALNRLVDYLLRCGHAVRVYSPVVKHPAFAPAGELVGVRSVPIPGRGEYRVALGLPRSTRADLADFAPHIVHVSAPDLLGRAAQAWAIAHGTPLVASLHTRFETYFEHYGLGFIRPAIERYLQRFYGRCDRVLAPNAPLADLLADAGLPRERIAIWGRGVDRDRFSPARRSIAWRLSHGIGARDCAVLFFGRLVREKGIAAFAEALARAEARNLRPVVVGDGPERKAFERAVPNAVFTGHLSGEALAEAVASCDILLNPSASEAFGNVNLEAMACGLAVVTCEAPNSRDLIVHERTGLLCAARDAGAMAKAVDRCAADARLRASLGAAARRASMAYDWDEALDCVPRAYAEVTRRGLSDSAGALNSSGAAISA